MTITTEIVCPKCGSNQLSANKKGFSGAKAVGGAILTGGIGLLAGTIGSNDILITCLACGKTFKPGEGSINTTSNNQSSTSYSQKTVESSYLEDIDKKIDELCKQRQFNQAVKLCHEVKGWELETSKVYVNSLIAKQDEPSKADINNSKSGCFIATACFGDYNAPEVLVLRSFRDTQLLRNPFGKLFVEFYYATSPFLAKIILKSDRLKIIVRHYFLNPIVTILRRQK